MHSAASPIKKERFSPSPCIHTASYGEKEGFAGQFLPKVTTTEACVIAYMLAVYMKGEGESLFFFSEASCTVHGLAKTV